MGDTNVCDCTCHTGPYASCDVPGGCGSVGCGRRSKPGACTTCPILRPDSDPRLPHRPPVCDGDRRLIDRNLGDIATLISDLSHDEPPVLDGRRHERFGVAYFQGNQRHVFSRGMFPSDPLAPLGGVAPINSKAKAPSVSGSRERPIPIPVTRLDLQARLRPLRLTQPFRGLAADQVGYLAAATVLAEWIRDIRDTLYPDQRLPKATVAELALWLRNRVDDICDRHPAVVEFAEEIRALRGALRAAAGAVEPRPELCEGVSCKRCDLRTMWRKPGDSYSAECASCGLLYSLEEYEQWTMYLANEVR